MLSTFNEPKTPSKEEQKKESEDWDLGTPRSCDINKIGDDDCESCQ